MLMRVSVGIHHRDIDGAIEVCMLISIEFFPLLFCWESRTNYEKKHFTSKYDNCSVQKKILIHF